MKANVAVIITFICMMLLNYGIFYQSPSNDAYAYYNIGANIITYKKAVTNEIFPNTLLSIKDYPVPIFRRSVLYSYLTVPFIMMYDSPLALSFLTMMISVINLIILMFIAEKLFSKTEALILGGLYILDPLTYSFAFSGIVEPAFTSLLIVAFYFLYRDFEIRNNRSFIIFSVILGLSLYLRPHALLYFVGTILYLLKNFEFKRIVIFAVVIIMISTPLFLYKQYNGITGSLSKYFLLDSLGGKYKNHKFERMIEPDEPFKVIMQNKLSMLKKMVRKTIAQLKLLVLHPFSTILLLIIIYAWFVNRKCHNGNVYVVLLIFLSVFFIFSTFFVERMRYYWPTTILMMIVSSKIIGTFSNKKKLILFFVLMSLFITPFFYKLKNISSVNKENYFTIRRDIMNDFKPLIKKGVMTDIPWCGAAFLKKPSIWIPAEWEDIKKVKKLTGINMILVSGVWIEPEKLIENFDINKLKKIHSVIHKFGERKITSTLYRMD